MRQAVLGVFTTCAVLGAVIMGMSAAAEAQTIIIIDGNGNRPYPPPYPPPYRDPVVYGYPAYYDGGYGYQNSGYYNGYGNGYYNGGCYTHCYPRPYGWGGTNSRRACA